VKSELQLSTIRVSKYLLLLSAAAVALQPSNASNIDYIASNVSPAASFTGQSGNFRLVDPIAPGASITFHITFSINATAQTTKYPREVTFGVLNIGKPDGAADPTVVLANATGTFVNKDSTLTTDVTITTPGDAVPGNYHVIIAAVKGTGGSVGLSDQSGVLVHFIVSPPTSGQLATVLKLTLDPGCILYRQPTVAFKATLTTTAGDPVPGVTIDLKVDGTTVASPQTDASGVVNYTYNSALLPVGDHDVAADFNGTSLYLPSGAVQILGVTYNFLGYQQPINADGSSVFSGATVTVKIKIADYYGNPVTDAAAFVFYRQTSPTPMGAEQEALPQGNVTADPGNQMRYDANADQYVFNWDVSSLADGTYTLRVELGEGSAPCGEDHIVKLSLGKKTSTKTK
jgi:hypothetical protein